MRSIYVSLALFALGLAAGPAAAAGRGTSADLVPVYDVYDYSVRPGTPEWKELETHEEMVQATQIDPSILASMSDEGLIRTVLSYPLLGDMLAFNDLQSGFETVRSRFGGLDELLRREEVPERLLRRYGAVDASAVPIVLSLEEQGRRAMDLFFMEMLLAQPDVLSKLSEDSLDELLLEVLVKREQKVERFDVYGMPGLESTALVGGRALELVEPAGRPSDKARAFLDTGLADAVETLDEVFSRIEAVVLGSPSSSLSQRSGLATKDYYSTVYTPNGSPVTVIVRTYELSGSTIASYNDWVEDHYPNATRMTNASRKYNCHSYAWYSQSIFNNRWMNTPGDDTYWQDGSYVLSSITSNRKVSYASDDHSAIALSGSLYESKWGQLPVMQHAPDYDPYNGSVLKGYRIPPPEVTVTGPISREPNESGTWTCSASGGQPPYSYSWFKSYDGGYTNLGTSSSQTTSHPTSFNIVCDVVDSTSTFIGTDFVFVDVDGEPDGPIFE